MDRAEAFNAATQGEEEAPSKMDLKSALQALEQATRRKRELDAESKETNKLVDFLATAVVPELMEQAGLVDEDGRGSVTLASGASVYLRNDLYASCPKAQRAKMLDWMRKHGHDGLIEENVHPSTLKSFCKDLLEEGQETPEGVNLTTQVKAIVKGLKV